MRSVVIASILAIGILAACADIESPATVKGHVYGNGCPGGIKCSPAPFNQAPVGFQPKAGGAPKVVYTDDDGFYSIQLPPGDYKVTLNRYVRRGNQDLHLSPGVTLVEDYEVVLIAG